MVMSRDRQRHLDAESQRNIRAAQLEYRKRAAFRVMDDGGTLLMAMAVSNADRRTVRRWLAERTKA
jgi:hypothetical protein